MRELRTGAEASEPRGAQRAACTQDALERARAALRARPRRWLVTGVAGFIGSHLLQELLELGQQVRGLDDFSTGREQNLVAVRAAVGEPAWTRFELVRGDLRASAHCRQACRDVQLVSHQAALGSVPRSLERPEETHAVNLGGSLTLFEAARAAGVRRVVYASSSSVYGDEPALPKREAQLGAPLSPYAASKRALELFAEAYRASFDLEAVGLRYFNVVGARQRPDGPYAAVLPRWLARLAAGRAPALCGDGRQTRDFTPVANVVAANLLAACTQVVGPVYNVALGQETRLDALARRLLAGFALRGACGEGGAAGVSGASRGDAAPGVCGTAVPEPEWLPARPGEVARSCADIELARRELGYRPVRGLEEELEERIDEAWRERATSGPV